MATPPEKLRVLLADDHGFYRQGLAKLLEVARQPGAHLVGELQLRAH
jgi:hypothetical protein